MGDSFKKGKGITVGAEEPFNRHDDDEHDLNNGVEEALHRTITDLKDKLAKAQRHKEANLHRSISELKDKLAKSERITEKANKEAEDYKERGDLLEEQLEKKSVMELQKEELARKTSNLEKLLDNERKKHEEERKKVADLDRQLMEERNRGNEDLMRSLEDRMRDQKKAEDLLLEFNATSREKDLLERRWDEQQKVKEEMNKKINEIEKMLEQASTIAYRLPRKRIKRGGARDEKEESDEVSLRNLKPVEIVDLIEDGMEIPVQISEPIDVPDVSTSLNDCAPSLIMSGGGETEEREETGEASILHDVSLEGVIEVEDSWEMHDKSDQPIDITDYQFEEIVPMFEDDLIENAEEHTIEHSLDFPMDSSEINAIGLDVNIPMTPEESTTMEIRSRSMKISDPVVDSDSGEEGPSVKIKWEPAKKRDEGSTDTVEMGKRRTSARMINYAESMDGSDWDEEPSVKKVKTENTQKCDKKVKSSGSLQFKPVKKDYSEKNELECPICEYTTKAVNCWIRHLTIDHSTTPLTERCKLRCDCGHESYTRMHSSKCDISNFTLIRDNEKNTPQCVSCMKYPRTPVGYVLHLDRCHKSTLLKSGIYLLCSCGFKYISFDSYRKHDKKCPGNEFTLHKN